MFLLVVSTWTPKVCKIMTFMDAIMGLGLLFYIYTFGGKEGNIELQSLYDIFPTTPSASVRFEMATFLKDSKSPTAPGLYGNAKL